MLRTKFPERSLIHKSGRKFNFKLSKDIFFLWNFKAHQVTLNIIKKNREMFIFQIK